MTKNKIIFGTMTFLALNGCMIHSDTWQAATAMKQREANLTECHFVIDNPFFSKYDCYVQQSNHDFWQLPLKHS